MDIWHPHGLATTRQDEFDDGTCPSQRRTDALNGASSEQTSATLGITAAGAFFLPGLNAALILMCHNRQF